jgi:large subunit ribosomal protein L25
MSIAAEFNVETRISGKGNSKALRVERKIPAVIYGPKMENKNVYIEELFVLRHSGAKHESSIFETKSQEKALSSLKVMLKRIDTHPVSNRPIHVDLYALDMTAKIRVHVSIEFIGEPIGIKEEGGVSQVILRELEIECKPNDIPKSISLDISKLSVGESVHVSDVTFPEGVKSMTPPERTILTVNLPKEEKAAEPVVAAEGDAAAPAAGAAPAAAAPAKK